MKSRKRKKHYPVTSSVTKVEGNQRGGPSSQARDSRHPRGGEPSTSYQEGPRRAAPSQGTIDNSRPSGTLQGTDHNETRNTSSFSTTSDETGPGSSRQYNRLSNGSRSTKSANCDNIKHTAYNNHGSDGHRQYRMQMRKCSGCHKTFKCQPVAGTSSQQDSTNQESDIPGFYFDPVKKKYFKVQPGHNTTTNTITREGLKEKKAEETRQQKLKDPQLKHTLDSLIFSAQDASDTKATKYRPKCHYSHNVYDILEGFRTSCDPAKGNTGWLRKRFSNHLVENLKNKGSVDFFPPPRMIAYDNLEHCHRMLPNADHSQMLCLWSLKDTMVSRIQAIKIKSVNISKAQTLSLDVASCNRPLLQHFSKVTHLCWANSEGDDEEKMLFTTTCFLGVNPSLALIHKLNPEVEEDYDPTVFSLGKKVTWTCAYNGLHRKFSVGIEGGSLLLDVNTRRLWELKTAGSDVFSQAFCPVTGQILYSGTKRGVICCHDLRSNSTRYTHSMRHRTSISHVLAHPDGNYLLASDFSGKLVRWDHRMRKVVMQYPGMFNEYTRLPFHLDSKNNIIYGADQNCETRLWDYASGELLTTLASPLRSSRDSIPCVSLALDNGRHMPGLYMAIHDKLYFYST